jgi:hypothetical protein
VILVIIAYAFIGYLDTTLMSSHITILFITVS